MHQTTTYSPVHSCPFFSDWIFLKRKLKINKEKQYKKKFAAVARTPRNKKIIFTLWTRKGYLYWGYDRKPPSPLPSLNCYSFPTWSNIRTPTLNYLHSTLRVIQVSYIAVVEFIIFFATRYVHIVRQPMIQEHQDWGKALLLLLLVLLLLLIRVTILASCNSNDTSDAVCISSLLQQSLWCWLWIFNGFLSWLQPPEMFSKKIIYRLDQFKVTNRKRNLYSW